MTKEANQISPLAEYRAEPLTEEEMQHLALYYGMELDSVIGLLNICPIRLLDRNDILISQGEDNRICYIILSGKLRIHLESINSDSVTVLHPGETVGELSLFNGRPASAYVVASKSSELLVLEEDIFWALVNASHGFTRKLLFLISQRLNDNNATITESIKKQQEYKHNAIIDELTGLHNRRWLQNILGRQMKRNQYNDETLSLMMVDIDHFKRINDTCGHLAGDRVLRHIAKIMMNNVRPTDLLARYGGEEFIAVLPSTDLAGARVVANRMCAAVCKSKVGTGENATLPSVTISIGIAQMQADEPTERLIERADVALYQAKDKGRNRVES